MTEIIVGIGRFVHRSVDGGSTWAKSLREIPGKRTPIVRGTVGLLRTTDHGALRRHIHVFERPDVSDVSERHMLTLQVR